MSRVTSWKSSKNNECFKRLIMKPARVLRLITTILASDEGRARLSFSYSQGFDDGFNGETRQPIIVKEVDSGSWFTDNYNHRHRYISCLVGFS